MSKESLEEIMECNDTGKMPMLACAGAKNADGEYILGNAVRVPCSNDGSGEICPVENGISDTHAKCGNRGWNPSTDLAVWLEACTVLGKTRIDLLYLEKWYVALEHGGDSYSGASILEALVSALARALVAQGDKLMEEEPR